MSMLERETPVYDDGRTKQSFKDQTNINKIMAKAARGGTISHLAKHGAVYGDFSDIDDLLTAHKRLERGKEIFNDLPGEIKREFQNSPRKFFNYVNDPANAGNLANVLPQLAQVGNQLVTPRRSAEGEAVKERDATLVAQSAEGAQAPEQANDA